MLKYFRKLLLLFHFYRNFLLASLLIDLCCIAVVWQYGLVTFFGLFWLKMASLALIYFFVNSYKSNEFYYYFNLGLTRLSLWVPVILFDLLFFLIVIIKTNSLR